MNKLLPLVLLAGLWLPPLQAAPLVAKLEDGSTVTLAGYPAGKPALVKFWATWCQDCRRQMPAMQALYDRYHDEISFIMVDVGFNESEAKVERFLRDRGYSFPFVFDGDASLSRAMEVFGTPTHLLLDASGKVLRRTGEVDDELKAELAALAGGEGHE